MNVRQLIEQLQMANPELPVTIVHHLGATQVILTQVQQVSVQKITNQDKQFITFIIVDESTRIKPEDQTSPSDVSDPI